MKLLYDCVCVCVTALCLLSRGYIPYMYVCVSFFSNTSTHKISFTLIRLSCGIIRRRKTERDRERKRKKEQWIDDMLYDFAARFLSRSHTFAYLIKQRHKKEHGDEEDQDEDFNSISFQFLTDTHTHTQHTCQAVYPHLSLLLLLLLLLSCCQSYLLWFEGTGRIRRNLSSNLDSGNDERRCRVFIKHLTHTHIHTHTYTYLDKATWAHPWQKCKFRKSSLIIMSCNNTICMQAYCLQGGP